MVEPTDTSRSRSLTRRAFVCACAALAILPGSGCGLVPKSKLDDCHRVSQTLRSENNRLKDVALDLRAQNQDLSQRAVDDARRLAAQEEAVDRLERSVTAYQAERDKMAAAFEAVKRQVRMAVSPHSAAKPDRLKAFAQAHSGWSFETDAAASTISVSAPIDRLFERGKDTLRPEAAVALKELADELVGSGAKGLAVEVIAPADAAPVVRARFDAAAEGSGGVASDASGRFLGAARAARVRDRLVTDAGLAPASARLAPPPVATTAADPARAGERRVEIRLRPRVETTTKDARD
jgi:chemotaxis protein MotB